MHRMNLASYPQHAHSTCPHNSPDTCALEVELLDANTIALADARWIEGLGVNALLSAEPGLPDGGAIYHDTAVWLKAAGKSS